MPTLGCLVFALLALGTLAQSQVSAWLALCTPTKPNTGRQRLKRLRQQPLPETACFQALLRAALAQLRPQVVLVLGVWVPERLRLWGRQRRSLGVYRLGRLVVQAWLLRLLAWDVGKMLGLEAGGELK